ncbi:MAG: hypothetical protein RSB09_04830 [Clostridia bacterium]
MASDTNSSNLYAINQIADNVGKLCTSQYDSNLLAITLAELICKCKTKQEIASLQQFFVLTSNAIRTYML